MSISRGVGRLVIVAGVAYLFAKGALVLRPQEAAGVVCDVVASIAHAHCNISGAERSGDSRSPAPRSPVALSDHGGAVEQRREGDLVRERQCHDRPEGGVGPASLNDSEMLGVDRRALGSLLLRQSLLLADGAQSKPETLSRAFDRPLDGGTGPDLRGSVGAVWR